MPIKLFGPSKIFDAQSVSGTNSYRSNVIDMLCMDRASMEIKWASGDTAIGVFSIDGTNDLSGTPVWYPTGSAITNPTGAGGPTNNTLVPLSRVEFRYLSLSYVNSSGSGSLTVVATAKGPGA